MELLVRHAVRQELAGVCNDLAVCALVQISKRVGYLAVVTHLNQAVLRCPHGVEQVLIRTYQWSVEVYALVDVLLRQCNLLDRGGVQQFVQHSNVVGPLGATERRATHIDHALAGLEVLDVQSA